MTLQLEPFKDGKYTFCLERKCELQDKLCDGDPVHEECWLCIVEHYQIWPDLNDLYTTTQIEALRK